MNSLKKYAWIIIPLLGLLASGVSYALATDRRVTVVETKQHDMEDDLHEIKADVKELLKR